MKTFLATFAIVALLATPALALNGKKDGGGYAGHGNHQSGGANASIGGKKLF